jgi:hypothetical protein
MVGRAISHHQILEKIGEGGMGVVAAPASHVLNQLTPARGRSVFLCSRLRPPFVLHYRRPDFRGKTPMIGTSMCTPKEQLR